MTRFLSSLCFAVLTVVLSFVILVLVVNPPRIEPTVPTFGKFKSAEKQWAKQLQRRSQCLDFDAAWRPTAGLFAENSEAHRLLSYEIRGDKSRPNCIIWLHGLLSSRFEVLAISEVRPPTNPLGCC